MVFSKKYIVLIILALMIGTVYSLKKKFHEDELHRIVKDSVNLPEKERLSFIVNELNHVYGTTTEPEFYLFNGGNAHGLVGLVHASLNEYLIIYGTPIKNSGHSGRYLMTVRDFIYRGKVCIACPEHLEGRYVYPGELTTLPWGTAHHYALDEHTWMIEYGYGFTPSSLPFMLFGLIATGDFVGCGKLIFGYSAQVIKNLFSF